MEAFNSNLAKTELCDLLLKVQQLRQKIHRAEEDLDSGKIHDDDTLLQSIIEED